MAILGRGSMRNPSQEEELRLSSDPKHNHLNEDLHVEISTFASPSEAHARLSLALSEVRAYMIPDSNDQIRQQQMRDIKLIKMTGTGSNNNTEVIIKICNLLEIMFFVQENMSQVTGEDSGHDSDMSSSSPTPPKPSSHVDTCHTSPHVHHNTSLSSPHLPHNTSIPGHQSPPTCKIVTSSSRSIFDKLFGTHVSHVGPERKRNNFLIDSFAPASNGGGGCGEPICKRFK